MPYVWTEDDNLTLLEPHVEQGIYRIAQEALENSVRYGKTTALWIMLTHSATKNQTEQIQLSIRDDGQGFDPSQTIQTGHYRVAGVKERASSIGGMLQVESSAQWFSLWYRWGRTTISSQFVNSVS